MINKLKELRETGSEEGFTLIELMIVVVIIGILAAIAIPIFMNQQKAAIVAGVKSDVKNTVTNIATALAKAPTASLVSNGFISNDAAGGAGDPGSIPFKVVKSDSNTSISVLGSWDAYGVRGTNSSIGTVPTLTKNSNGEYVAATTAGSFAVVYSSATGDTVTSGD